MKAKLVVFFSLVCLMVTAQRVTLDINQDYIPILTQNGDTLVSSVPYGNHWVFNGEELEDEINQTLIHPKNGTYLVYVVDFHTGCVSHSDSLSIFISSVPSISEKKLTLCIHPNPNKGLFNMTLEYGKAEIITFELIALDGKKLAEKKVFYGGVKQEIPFGKEHLSSGIYNVRIQMGSKQVVQKVIVE